MPWEVTVTVEKRTAANQYQEAEELADEETITYLAPHPEAIESVVRSTDGGFLHVEPFTRAFSVETPFEAHYFPRDHVEQVTVTWEEVGDDGA